MHFPKFEIDFLAFVFFFQNHVFHQRKLPEDANLRNVEINTQKTAI